MLTSCRRRYPTRPGPVSFEHGDAGGGRQAILLLGRQGAGKGLIGHLLAENIHASFLSMGHLLRSEQRSGSDLGREIGVLINSGHGVPPEVSYGLMEAAIARSMSHGPLVIDGIPRRANEIGRVRAVLRREPSAVVVLHVPTPIAVERVLTRQSCRECGMPHGPAWPARNGRCHSCGDLVGARADDADLIRIHRRLEVWGTEAREIIRYYAQIGLVRDIAADGAVLAVLESVVAALGIPAR